MSSESDRRFLFTHLRTACRQFLESESVRLLVPLLTLLIDSLCAVRIYCETSDDIPDDATCGPHTPKDVADLRDEDNCPTCGRLIGS